MKKILNISEMKQVRGGAAPSKMCGEGEQLYTCTSDYGNGQTSIGAVCAKSGNAAGAAVMSAHGAAGSMTVVCN
ncbi:hypothetical protein [Bacteroides oleiciplenus]|uniref:Uncharacterized protein n=2 Tax=Bacteroides oleiciplenus TaxID=626931 RepID=K9E1K0_9BACE|nr:hypothetical protein [Bacteroides oleiciplenus]EKU89541.1 hypothetical protein HMPREF9447_02979 [Bacteroides oleiciplenus YIT 12058]RGN40141.1 hypothetical protein DXB65_00360 [Bacteroides oleiciplenus]